MEVGGIGSDFVRALKEAASHAVYVTGYKDGVRDTWGVAALVFLFLLIVICLLTRSK